MKSRLLLLCLFSLVSARTQHERQDEETACTTPEMAQPNKACKGLFRKWAFNDVSGHCERFAFGGCHPGSLTNNLYDSKYECMAKCEKSKMLRGKPGPPTDLCYLPPVKGMISCMAFMPRWTFDVSATEGPRCIRYIYGGCAGTANLFTSETDCLAACGDTITNIAKKCPLRELVSSCDQYCSGDRDCDNGQVCCPSSGNECGPQCVPPVTSFTLTENSSDSTITAQERSTLTLQKRNICQQPIRKGLCSASMRKFAFKPEKNRCEVFTYGGCQGNGNNFASANDCQKTCGGDVPNTDPACESVQCDVTSIRPYQDRQCLPEYADGACCPTSYSCDAETEEPLSEPENHVCLYKGQGYEAGPIPAITLDDPCYNCSCMPPTKPYTTKASVICTLQTCPPLGNPPSTDCIIVKVPGQCCNEWKCDLARPLSTCTANNQTEFEGGVFYPTPCRKCICTANYTDENGYGCSDEVCFHQLPSACVPVYEDGVCCPVDFNCPTGEEHTATPPVRAVTLPFKIDRSTLRHQPFNQSHCLLPHDVGKCKTSSFRFHYDVATQKCLGFYYGGCHGNKNRFSTEAECEQACAGVTLENASAPTDIASRILPHKPAEDVCQHPKDPGPCRGFVPLYYYDGATGACQRFMYGGCKGNGNRFLSQQDCEGRCTKNSDPSAQNFSICSLPLAKGPCRAKKPRFFFNATSQQCEPFSYGGCVGNDNNFITLALCETECKPKTDSAIEARMVPVDPSKVEDGATAGVSVTSESSPILPDLAPEASVNPPPIPEFCSLPSDIGPCRAHKPRYFHNPATGHCEKFHFGGCRGNKNNFHTQKECETVCQIGAQGSGPETVQPHRNKLVPNLGREQCKLPMDPGPCRMAAPRYFHDSQTGKCEPFNYGGCEGNANNYLTAEECQVRCGKGISRKEYDEIMGHRGHGKHKKSNAKTHCSLPADPGFCLAYMPRFHYDSAINECKLFIYGGCKGNANNFRTQQECLEHCGPESNATVTLPTNSVCRFGNLTLNQGEKLSKNGTCFDCVCITPPDLTCTKMACVPVPRKATLPQVDPVESTDEENADSKEKDEVKDNSSDETSSEDKED